MRLVAVSLLAQLGACATGPERPQPQARTFAYGCDGDYRFVARVAGGSAWLFLPDITVNLPQAAGGSGKRFAGSRYRFTLSGETAELQTDRHRYQCRNDRATAVWEAARLDGVEFRAVGNEPGWVLEIDATNTRMLADYGERRLQMATPPPEIDSEQRLTRYRARSESVDVVIEIEADPCQDSMSGALFPARVVVDVGGRRYTGCGRALH